MIPRSLSQCHNRLLAAEPIGLASVALEPGSRLFEQRAANSDRLLNLDPARLTCLYTSGANITCSTSGTPYHCTATAQQSVCTPYGHPRYYGHYLGHYLSAVAMTYEATGNVAMKERGDDIVSTLAKCQAAHTANGEPGLLYPYDVRSFQNLYDKAPSGNCQPICVPFYVVHKTLAGMLDQHTRAGNAQALGVAAAMANWTRHSVEGMISRWGINKWQMVLDTEWGGMNEGLLNLYALTSDAAVLATAKRFTHWRWTAPLAAGIDDLDGSHGNDGGNHANTHIPEVVGSARAWELTGNETERAIATNFFNILTAGQGEAWDPAAPGGHSWATGGSNSHEHWFNASLLGDSLDGDTEESCTTYNVLKVARHLFGWGADARLADFYERAFLNGIMGNIVDHRPAAVDGAAGGGDHTVELEYMLPLGGAGLGKPWATAGPESSFPCCWGTLSETYAKVGDSIYFRAPGNASRETLYVSQSNPQQRPVASLRHAAGVATGTSICSSPRPSRCAPAPRSRSAPPSPRRKPPRPPSRCAARRSR